MAIGTLNKNNQSDEPSREFSQCLQEASVEHGGNWNIARQCHRHGDMPSRGVTNFGGRREKKGRCRCSVAVSQEEFPSRLVTTEILRKLRLTTMLRSGLDGGEAREDPSWSFPGTHAPWLCSRRRLDRELATEQHWCHGRETPRSRPTNSSF